MTKVARIILLNGAGSVGKTATAQALQAITTDPFLHVPMDSFLDMLPATYRNHPDGIRRETLQQDGRPSTAIHTGPLAESVLRGMRHAVAAMAKQGNDMIVDDSLLGGVGEMYRKLLAPYQLWVVGLFAPLDVLEARERKRTDRQAGVARWQFDRVHEGVVYDLGIDTSTDDPVACAMTIKLALKL